MRFRARILDTACLNHFTRELGGARELGKEVESVRRELGIAGGWAWAG
jgi:hypothetical protein